MLIRRSKRWMNIGTATQAGRSMYIGVSHTRASPNCWDLLDACTQSQTQQSSCAWPTYEGAFSSRAWTSASGYKVRRNWCVRFSLNLHSVTRLSATVPLLLQHRVSGTVCLMLSVKATTHEPSMTVVNDGRQWRSSFLETVNRQGRLFNRKARPFTWPSKLLASLDFDGFLEISLYWAYCTFQTFVMCTDRLTL